MQKIIKKILELFIKYKRKKIKKETEQTIVNLREACLMQSLIENRHGEKWKEILKNGK